MEKGQARKNQVLKALICLLAAVPVIVSSSLAVSAAPAGGNAGEAGIPQKIEISQKAEGSQGEASQKAEDSQGEASQEPAVPYMKENRTVKVAYPIQAAVTDVDENGNYTGYTYEYLEEIAQYTGWDYEFIQMDEDTNENLSVLMDRVTDGEIDLMGGMLYMDELSEQYTFARQSYGSVETVLQTLPENVGHVYINSLVTQPMRIAVLNTKGRSVRELEGFCKMNLIEPQYVLCGDETDQIEAVRQGRADALLNTSMNYLEGVRTIARFAPKPFYFVTAKNGDPELIDQLNNALLSIEQSDPYFSATLYDKYFEPDNETFSLSEEDKEYIEASESIRVGFLSNQPPFQYKDEESGEFRGITMDILDIIEQETGMKVELVRAESMDALFAMAEAGEIQVIAGLSYDYTFAREHHIAMTRSYITSQYMRIMSEEIGRTGIQGKRLALPSTSTYDGYTVGAVVYYDTRSECVRAVKRGEADYTYADACTAQYFINQPEYWNLKMVPLAYTPIQFCFGMIKPVDQNLLTLFNKVIRSVSVEEVQSIISQNTYPRQSLSFFDLMREHPIETVSLVAGILFLIIALLLLLLYQRIKSSREAAVELKKRLRVYALANDYFFEYNFRKRDLVVSLPSSQEPDGAALLKYKHDNEKETDEGSGESVTFWSLVELQKDGVYECRQLCADGEWHWLRLALEIIRDHGEPVYAIGKINLIDAEKEEIGELEAKACLDGLTGIYNVQTCRIKIGEALSSMKEGENGAFLLIDIDHFKFINDNYGHMEGDRVLCYLAALLREKIRSGDIAGRFGGDEFIVYFCSMRTEETLEKRCEAFCKELRRDSELAGRAFTVSIGAALSHPGDTYEQLLQKADEQMYMVKKQGRAGYHIAEDKAQTLGGEPMDQTGHAFIGDSLEEDSGEVLEQYPQWLLDECYQTVLRETKTVAFEYDPQLNIQYVSPFIRDYISGNYDGRMLSQVMLEDGVIYPDDLELSTRFREQVKNEGSGEMTLRLKTPSQEYHWFKMNMCPGRRGGRDLMVGVISDVDVEMRQREILRYRAEFDPISGIYNKGAFYEAAQRMLAAAPDKLHILIQYDIDRFKIINELYSISEGDKVLRQIGDITRELVKPGEVYARMSNDIFCLCLERPQQEAIWLLEELERRMNNYPIAFQFILSAGIVRIPHYDGQPVNVLCDRAAMAQRTVKGSYINHYAFYEDKMSDSLSWEHKMIGYMRRALDEEQFYLHFQPKYDMRDNSVIGAEALVRWKHPVEGIIWPGDFIPLFERNDFILRLDEYIWERACRYIRGWIDRGYKQLPISVNVSRLHLHDPDFCDKVITLCRKYDLPPRLLEMEITESAYIESPKTLYDIMDRLQKEGFHFLMDDFGSGYSSLNVLKDIPVDLIKIDLNFLREARRGEEAGRTVLRGAVQLVRGMNLPIVAEGVETREQADFLLSVGCYYAQGYYYSKPLPPEEFEKLLQKEEP